MAAAAPKPPVQTPMMRQYLAIKRNYADAFLFYRMGDFYELFLDDAIRGAPLLDIALTTRDRGKADAVPMCGVPVHGADAHIQRLAALGHRVAICDQVEDARATAGRRLVRREVVEVITPGLIGDPGGLEAHREVQIAALWETPEAFGLAVLEASCGAFRCTAVARGEAGAGGVPAALWEELRRVAPREILLDATRAGRRGAQLRGELPGVATTEVPAQSFDPAGAPARPEGLDAAATDPGSRAAAALLGYVAAHQPFAAQQITRLRPYRLADAMELDAATRRHLELLENGEDKSQRATAIAHLDATTTPLGARCLRRWLVYPLLNPVAICARQDAVAYLAASDRRRQRLREALRGVRDLERRLAVVGRPNAGPRDLAALRASLAALPGVVAALGAGDGAQGRGGAAAPREARAGDGTGAGEAEAASASEADVVKASEADAGRANEAEAGEASDADAGAAADEPGPPASLPRPEPVPEAHRLLAEALVDEPPALARGSRGALEVGYIRRGYRPELDAWRESARTGRADIAALEAGERQRTGIANLKVRFHPVHGYALEVSKANLGRVPADYERRQTLAQAERFTTRALRELEVGVRGAHERAAALERDLFAAVREAVLGHRVAIAAAARAVAELDALASLAEVARRDAWVRPEVHAGLGMEIEAGRHPVVEALLRERGGGEEFVPNDTVLQPDGTHILLLTGPNMSGKSTYLRQVALIALLAQMGSFVPARRARIGVIDRIFTRVGASDRMSRGESTFLVEMRETAEILTRASRRSLVILDEIGRGTSTFDGLSIAWAVAEYLHDTPDLCPRTLFATHYHELIELATTKPRFGNAHFTVRERGDDVIFPRRLAAGGATRSYGIQVARLAGLPPGVVERARILHRRFERGERRGRRPPPPPHRPAQFLRGDRSAGPGGAAGSAPRGSRRGRGAGGAAPQRSRSHAARRRPRPAGALARTAAGRRRGRRRRRGAPRDPGRRPGGPSGGRRLAARRRPRRRGRRMKPVLSLEEPLALLERHGGSAAAGNYDVQPVVQRYLTAVRGHLRERHRAGLGGGATNALHSDLMDRLLRRLFQVAEGESLGAGHGAADPVALLAVGGYARREMALHSDLDLLLLHGGRPSAHTAGIAERLQYWLWDGGLAVGCATRSIQDTVRLARRDTTVFTGILDTRFLAGDPVFYHEFGDQLRRRLLGDVARFLALLATATAERRARYGDSLYLLQPNLKEGEGGLRDYHTALWALRAVLPSSRGDPDDFLHYGLLTEAEMRAYRHALDFLWQVRNELHLLVGRRFDQMGFDHQEGIAESFGYPGGGADGVLPVERFMGDYYRNARTIRNYSESALEQCRVRTRSPRRRRPPFREVEDGFRLVEGALDAPHPHHLRDDPLRLLRAFAVAQAHDAPLRRGIQRLVREHLHLVDDAYRRDPAAAELFLGILDAPRRVTRSLMVMNEVGLLGRYLPEWQHIECRWQHVAYHTYTVDVHSIFLVEELRRLWRGKYERDYPELTALMRGVEDRPVLLLGCLLHDIGKGLGGDHSRLGAERAVRSLERLGLAAERAARVIFLVEKHLVMSHVSQRRDLSDPKTVLEFARQVEDGTNLRLLYLLTFADMRASSKVAWTEWKGTLLEELFQRCAERLQRGDLDVPGIADAVEDRVAARRRAAEPLLAQAGFADEDIEALYANLPQRYFAVHAPHQIARHAEALRRFAQSRELSLQMREVRSGVSELIICCGDARGLYAQVAGTLAARGINILASHVYTTAAGEALEIYRVATPPGGKAEQQRAWADFERTLRGVRSGELALERLLVRGGRHYGSAARKPSAQPPSVTISNQESDNFTVVDISTDDRLGLLYDLTRTLAEHGLAIHLSKATTVLDQAADSFYVRDVANDGQLPPERMLELREALLVASRGGADRA